MCLVCILHDIILKYSVPNQPIYALDDFHQPEIHRSSLYDETHVLLPQPTFVTSSNNGPGNGWEVTFVDMNVWTVFGEFV